jgi:hypothetical protein
MCDSLGVGDVPWRPRDDESGHHFRLGRMEARVGGGSGRRQAESARQNGALLGELGEVKLALMKGKSASGAGWRSDITQNGMISRSV